jgi:hypothetical protein
MRNPIRSRLKTHTDLYATTGTYRNMLADVMIAAEQLCEALVGHGTNARQLTTVTADQTTRGH